MVQRVDDAPLPDGLPHVLAQLLHPRAGLGRHDRAAEPGRLVLEQDPHVAGTTLQDAIAVTCELQAQKTDVSLDLLGETVDDLAESATATKAYIEAVRAIAEIRLGATVSVKLSQLGIGLDPTVCGGGGGGARRGRHGAQLGGPGDARGVPRRPPRPPHTRIAVQAAMRRTPSDLESFTAVKPRMVKGAFLEPIEKSLQERSEITAQYRYLAGWALANLPDPAFGTHDDACIEHVIGSAARQGLGPRDYEFQMLHGVRRDVQRRLADEGYRVRVYLPYGTR